MFQRRNKVILQKAKEVVRGKELLELKSTVAQKCQTKLFFYKTKLSFTKQNFFFENQFFFLINQNSILQNKTFFWKTNFF